MPTIRDVISKKMKRVRVCQSPAGQLTFLGTVCSGGTYLLRIKVEKQLAIAFGRFKRGKVIGVQPGEYLYIGSALAECGATCLARRLLRHATRTSGKSPHRIRAIMVDQFERIGLGSGDLLPKNGKHLRWNVDHLLDEPSVELTAAYIIRSPRRLEASVGKMLENDAATVVFERGLGANDIRGNTHLMRVEAGESWWQMLPAILHSFLQKQMAFSH